MILNNFNSSNLNLEYKVIGEGRPFIFLHGLGGDISQIISAYQEIAGVQLITLNQQGHGNSEVDWDNYNFEYLANDVINLMDHLKIEKAVIGGISMGAAVSLNLSLRYPERVEKLLLVRSAWLDTSMSSWLKRAFFDLGCALREGGLEAFNNSVGYQIVDNHSSYVKNAFIKQFNNENNHRNWEKFILLPNCFPVIDLDNLSDLNMPVYLVGTQNDMIHPYEFLLVLKYFIKQAKAYEIVDKSIDESLHGQQLNNIIEEIFR